MRKREGIPLRGECMRLGRNIVFALLILGLGTGSAFAGEGSPLGGEIEIYSGGLVGDSVGSTLSSTTKGNYGARFSLGLTRFLSWEMDYNFSDQTTTIISPFDPGAAITSKNRNAGSTGLAINLFSRRRAKVYVSPGVGFVKTGARQFSVEDAINGLGTAPLPIDTGLSFNMGGGVKIYPTKRVGFRVHVSNIITRDVQGVFDTGQLLDLNNGTQVDPSTLFQTVPGRKQMSFTIGLLFRLF